jgi:hypothetical protein
MEGIAPAIESLPSRRPFLIGLATSAAALCASHAVGGVLGDRPWVGILVDSMRADVLCNPLAVGLLALTMSSLFCGGFSSGGKLGNPRKGAALVMTLVVLGGLFSSASALTGTTQKNVVDTAHLEVGLSEPQLSAADSQLNESRRKLLQYTVMPGPPAAPPTPMHEGVSDADQSPYLPPEFMSKEAKLVRTEKKMESTLETSVLCPHKAPHCGRATAQYSSKISFRSLNRPRYA